MALHLNSNNVVDALLKSQAIGSNHILQARVGSMANMERNEVLAIPIFNELSPNMVTQLIGNPN